MADLAARGLGVAVLSESMAGAHRDRLTARAIDDVDIPALPCLVRRPAPGPAVRELLAYGRRASGGLPEPAAAGDDPQDSRAAPPEEQ